MTHFSAEKALMELAELIHLMNQNPKFKVTDTFGLFSPSTII